MGSLVTAALTPSARVWRADGQAATVVEIGTLGVYAVLDGERLAVLLGLASWRLALPCDVCPRPAEVRVLHTGEVLCKSCAHVQPGGRTDWAQPISGHLIRELYDDCERLG